MLNLKCFLAEDRLFDGKGVEVLFESHDHAEAQGGELGVDARAEASEGAGSLEFDHWNGRTVQDAVAVRLRDPLARRASSTGRATDA
jgi:hypothetical protein